VSEGYRRAGFRVIGVDIEPQPRFFRKADQGDEFHQADMLDVLGTMAARGWRRDISVIHVSPPCQRWSRMSTARPGLDLTYPDLITPVRPLLQATGLPYVIENVPGAPLINPVTLCAWQFGREMYRHRLFEAGGGLTLVAPASHPPHVTPASKAGHWVPGTFFSMAGHFAPMWKAQEVSGIDWMRREEMAEAIPPYMITYLAHQVLAQLLLAA
jgi:DNA (cytosine-5)-methyltransferase 1